MALLNIAVTQLRDLLMSMTPGARVSVGLLLAIVLVGLGYLTQQSSAEPDECLFGGEPLSAGQLNAIEAAISERGLTGWQREGSRIRVPAGQKAQFLAAIAEGDALPRNFHNLLENALDQGSFWDTPESRRERNRVAKQQTISGIIRSMPWVEEAFVLYDEQRTGGLRRQKIVTASVNVRPVAGETLSALRVKTLQNSVAHAIAGLRPENVAVTSLGGDCHFAPGGGIATGDFDNQYLHNQAKAKFVHTLEPKTGSAPTMANTALAWTSRNWSTVTISGLAVFSLLMLRSMVKSPRRGGTAVAPGLSLESTELPEIDKDAEYIPEAGPQLRLPRDHACKKEMIELVREDPETVASILRTWIGKPA